MQEIIIDGVNVAECKRRIGQNSYCRYFKRPCAENNFNCIWKQHERLKAENEELKEKNKFLDSMTGIFSARQAKKYHQALEEIREDMQEDTTCESRECGCDDYAECINCLKETIITKINEVLK